MTPTLRFKKEDGSAYPEWVKQPLEEIVEFSKGNAISKGDLSEDGVPTILYGELYTRYGHVIDEVYSRTEKTFPNPRVSEGNEVLIPSSGETVEDIAVASALTVPGVLLGGDMNVLRTSSVDNRYLSFLLNTKHKRDLQLGAQGKSVVHLYSASIKKIVAEIADNEEQAKIANFLAALDARITDQRELVELLEKRKQGMLQRVFSQQVRFVDADGQAFPEWAEKRLFETGQIVTGNTPSKAEPTYWSDATIPWITPTDIGDGHEIYDSSTRLSIAGAKKARVVPKGTLLVTCIASIGKNVILQKEGAFNQQINGIVVNEGHDVRFLYYLMETDKARLLSIAGRTATPIINKNTFGLFCVRICSLPEQQKIADFFTALDEEIDAARSLLNDYVEQKNAMLQQLFA